MGSNHGVELEDVSRTSLSSSSQSLNSGGGTAGCSPVFKDDRSGVLVDLQIFEGLPDGSVAQPQLLARIEELLAGLDQRRDARRSNPR